MKITLNEVKAMNKIAGTELTKEQEIAFIKNRLSELEFSHQASFDAYKKTHKMRPDTKVKIAGKDTTAGEASKKPGILQKLGAKLFGKKEEPIQMPKLDPKHPLNKIAIYSDDTKTRVTIKKALENPEKYKDFAAKIQSLIDTDPDGSKAQKYIDKKSKERKAAYAAKKERIKKQKEYLQWRKDNPELAAKRDAEEAERKKKEEEERIKDRNRRIKMLRRSGGSDTGYGSSGGSGFGGGSFGGGGFGGFGGGSFGGGGAGSSW
jgi:hypothetical protein